MMTTNSKHRVVIIGGGSMIASRIKNKLNCHIITTSSKNISADYLLDLRDFQEKDVKFIKQKRYNNYRSSVSYEYFKRFNF